MFELFGEGAERVLGRLFRGRRLPAAGQAGYGDLTDVSGDVIDDVVLFRVPAAGMWCVLEAWCLSVHGGRWIQMRVAEVLTGAGGEQVDAREVLRRAVDVHVLDATQAAAYEHLIEARTERAALFFVRQRGGELGAELRACLRLLESADETAWRHAAARLDRLLLASRPAYRLGHPLRLLIAGKPNTGKSTLFNRWVEDERAAVSREVGTTRDLNRESIAFAGFPVEVLDSAGLHPSPADPVEEEAVRKVYLEEADVVVYLVAPPWVPDAADEEALGRLRAPQKLVVANFADLAPPGERPAAPAPGASGVEAWISALDGAGVGELRDAIVERCLEGAAPSLDSGPAPFTAQQIALLRRAAGALDAAGEAVPATAGLDAVRKVLIECLDSSWPGISAAGDRAPIRT